MKVYLDGALQLSGWSVDTSGLVTFSTAPALGVEVTADFEFDVPARFDTDHMAVTIETYRLHAWQQIPIVELSFADDFAGARAYAGVTATAATVLDVHKNGSPIGTITFGIGASAGTFATAGGGAETFAAGDRLAIINENPADATLADLSITFLGKRT